MGFLSKIKERKKEILLLFVVLVFCFAFIEIIVRLTYYPPQDKGYPKELHIIDDYLGYKLQQNYTGNFPMEKYNDRVIAINSNGLRDDETNYTKSKKSFRILSLGDSCTFGSGVNNNQTYPAILENSLKEMNLSVETINAGVSGYEFKQEYTYYYLEGYKYGSDVVTIGIVLNDIYDPNITQIKKNMVDFGYHDRMADSHVQKLLKSLCHSCVLIYSLANNYNNKYFDEIYNKWDDEQAFSNYSEEIKRLNANPTKENKNLVLVIYPYTQQFKNSENRGNIPQEKIKKMAENLNITVVDLLPVLDREDYLSLYLYGDNLHLNEKGNKIVADEIAKKVYSIIKNKI